MTSSIVIIRDSIKAGILYRLLLVLQGFFQRQETACAHQMSKTGKTAGKEKE